MDEVSAEAAPPDAPDPDASGSLGLDVSGADPARLQQVQGKRARRAGRGFPRPRLTRPHLPRFRFAWPVAVLSAVAVLLAVAVGLLTWQIHGQSAVASQRTAVLTAARQEALDLTTLSKTTGASDFQAVVSGAAGNLKQELADGRGDFLKALSSDAVTSVGQVLDAGIVTMNGASATVLLNVSSSVTNKQAGKPETRLYHWKAALVDSGGQWLVTNLEFV
jgi:Mce-associated membrane protein